jgi:hypothetical protein
MIGSYSPSTFLIKYAIIDENKNGAMKMRTFDYPPLKSRAWDNEIINALSQINKLKGA